jgi:hypothetical protein
VYIKDEYSITYTGNIDNQKVVPRRPGRPGRRRQEKQRRVWGWGSWTFMSGTE